MKIQCNVCGSAEAAVLCCADEATLCWVCDQKVHAANKLASKHQRVPLSTSSSSQMQPKCDICQETVGYFFCLEDRALLCRKCDVAIHTVNSLVSVHQRFLLTGVKVGLEPTEPVSSSSSSAKTDNTEKISEVEHCAIPKIANPLTSSSQYCSKSIPVKASVGEDFSSPKLPFAGGSSTGTNAQWQLDEFVGLGDFSQNCNFMVNSSSKAAENELEGDEHKGALTETFWAVPQITSLATACELNWPKTYQNPSISPVFVPDISSWPMQNHAHSHQSHITSSKRKRHV